MPSPGAMNFREAPLTGPAVTDAEASHFILGIIAVQDCRHHSATIHSGIKLKDYIGIKVCRYGIQPPPASAEASYLFQFFHWEYADEAKQDKMVRHYDIMMSE